jgi:tRNA G18 (ribose-2'-O)-methylase SpoU
MVIVGTEFAGLDKRTAAICDALVRIPMVPGIDSLNVAVAAGICLDRLCGTRRV